jgi:hypothetical protein
VGRPGQIVAAAVVLALLELSASVASADALILPPRTERVRFGDAAGVHGGVLADVRAIGPVGGDRLALWPDRGLGTEAERPGLAAGRLGAVVVFGGTQLSVIASVDAAELLRPEIDGQAPWEHDRWRFAMSLVDDLALDWAPSRALRFTLGRQRVPGSIWRTIDERDLPLALVPQIVDRRVPDRRNGLTVSGDLGALAYAAGVYEELDELATRHIDDARGPANSMVLGVAALRWTPFAPMSGSNPPGHVTGALGPLPTPTTDPWYDTLRMSGDLALVGRLDRTGKNTTTQLVASLQLKWRWLGLVGEVLTGSDLELGADGELMITPWDRLSVHGRAEWDAATAGGTWTLGGGFAWHATEDRRNRIGLVAWARRNDTGRLHEDAAIVCLQASL